MLTGHLLRILLFHILPLPAGLEVTPSEKHRKKRQIGKSNTFDRKRVIPEQEERRGQQRPLHKGTQDFPAYKAALAAFLDQMPVPPLEFSRPLLHAAKINPSNPDVQRLPTHRSDSLATQPGNHKCMKY